MHRPAQATAVSIDRLHVRVAGKGVLFFQIDIWYRSRPSFLLPRKIATLSTPFWPTCYSEARELRLLIYLAKRISLLVV